MTGLDIGAEILAGYVWWGSAIAVGFLAGFLYHLLKPTKGTPRE